MRCIGVAVLSVLTAGVVWVLMDREQKRDWWTEA